MMDLLFKSPAGIASLLTFAFVILMGGGLTLWFMRKMKHPDED